MDAALSDPYDFRKNKRKNGRYEPGSLVRLHEIETKMDTPVTPSIGLFHADKQAVEALGPVVQLAKSGFFYCTQGEMSLVLGNRAFA